jgi:hypothetical protein
LKLNDLTVSSRNRYSGSVNDVAYLEIKKEALAIDAGDALESRFGGQQQLGFRPGSLAAEDLLDLAPHRFDGIEVG